MRWRSIQLRYRYPGAAGAVSATWLLPGPVVAQPQFRPPADVYETDGALVVRAELAGLPEGALDVQLYQDALVVEGERPFALVDGRRFHEVGIRSGPFRLEVPLPHPADRAVPLGPGRGGARAGRRRHRVRRAGEHRARSVPEAGRRLPAAPQGAGRGALFHLLSAAARLPDRRGDADADRGAPG